MKAPDKIYVTKNMLGELRNGWDALPSEVFPNIEYTRTDAFIDKACEWITQYILNHDQLDIFEMENDFRKAMEE